MMAPADRFVVVDEMTRAAIRLGWLPISAESSESLVAVTVRPATEEITEQPFSPRFGK
jgi:hypothetical protein